jgi:hypothetical protein
MGLLKLLKKMFSKNKESVDNKQNLEKEKITPYVENDPKSKIDNENNKFNSNNDNINFNDNKQFINNYEKIKNEEKENNYQKNELDNYLESEQLIKLKFLNKNKNKEQENINQVNVENISENQLNTIWDLLKIKENTQAEHIINSIPSDKWVTMDEIRHNIKLNFNVEYSNEKSLYPYLKTLTDINLIKLNNIGKKRSWKKNIIIIKK